MKINQKILFLENLLIKKIFINILKMSSLITFDKHSKNRISEYKIVRNDIWCEYCFKGAIEDLFNIAGIEKVARVFFAFCLLLSYHFMTK